MPPVIYVLAGVNGAGKSSIGAEAFESAGASVFNPDTVAQKIRKFHPRMPLEQANIQAWQIGRRLLEKAIREGQDYRFETTLGGNTMVRLLEQASQGGHQLRVWFCGLESIDLHIQRVAQRVSYGGHDIPVAKIRERWVNSRKNLIRLLPWIEHLRIYDNSFKADPFQGHRPHPILLLEMQEGKIISPFHTAPAPRWVRPIIAAALRLDAQVKGQRNKV